MLAENQLASRARTQTESYLTYIKEILSLCQRVDTTMIDEVKGIHILSGIADDAFQFLFCRNCQTVENVINECRQFQQAQSRRIAHKFTRLSNTTPMSTCEAVSTPIPLSTHEITKIVRRELEAMMPAKRYTRCYDDCPAVPISMVQTVIWNELGNLDVPQRLQEYRPRPSVDTRSYGCFNIPRSSQTPCRDAGVWRTDDHPTPFAFTANPSDTSLATVATVGDPRPTSRDLASLIDSSRVGARRLLPPPRLMVRLPFFTATSFPLEKLNPAALRGDMHR